MDEATAEKSDVEGNENAVSEQSTNDLIQYGDLVSDDDIDLLCAVVFIEDAAKYRDISHKLDKKTLLWYRWYFSTPVRISFYIVIFVLHMLAFFEYPSSLTWTSDIRHRGDRVSVPCGVTEGIEMICFLFISVDIIIKYKLIGRSEFMKKKWLIAASIILLLSVIDWFITIGFVCTEAVRYRRVLRPFFILSNSQLMKKTVKCVQKTLPEVITILLLLLVHLYVFTLLGMLMFPQPQDMIPVNNGTTPVNGNNSGNSSDTNVTVEGDEYFKTLLDSFMNLLVLLTTANNPDVMMPAYQKNRLFSLYFIIFLIIGNYCFMNMFLAVIYNQFRGYFKSSLQASLLRRRVGLRAAYEVLLKTEMQNGQINLEASYGVDVNKVKTVTQSAGIPRKWKNRILAEIELKQQNGRLSSQIFQECFDVIQSEKFTSNRPVIRWFGHPVLRILQKCVAHKFFTYFGNVVAVVNVIVITIELATQYDKSFNFNNSVLNIVNFCFVVYYLVEQILKFVMFGFERYVFERSNIYDGIITFALVVAEIFSIAEYGLPVSRKVMIPRDSVTLWNVVRIVNILIMARILRIIPQVKAMSIVFNTLVDLIKNMKAFAGILIAIYYSFAIVGIEIFNGSIKYSPPDANNTVLEYKCGTYQQLEYWANNFDDFAAAIVVLWDVMVVNNWSVFLSAYKNSTSHWAYLYFIVWWLFSVVIVLQLFTAIIIENFIMKWDKHQISIESRGSRRSSSFEESHHFMSVHDMFRSTLEEPSESEILQEISNHRYLKLGQIPSIT